MLDPDLGTRVNDVLVAAGLSRNARILTYAATGILCAFYLSSVIMIRHRTSEFCNPFARKMSMNVEPVGTTFLQSEGCRYGK